MHDPAIDEMLRKLVTDLADRTGASAVVILVDDHGVHAEWKTRNAADLANAGGAALMAAADGLQKSARSCICCAESLTRVENALAQLRRGPTPPEAAHQVH